MALLAWTLVATVSKNVGTTLGNTFPIVVGDSIYMVLPNATTNDLDLWVSNDRGASWAQFAMPSSSATDIGNAYGPIFFDDKLWVQQSGGIHRVYHTPAASPGTFTEEDPIAISPLSVFAPDRDHLYFGRAGGSAGRRLSSTSYVAVSPTGLNAGDMNKCPGTNDEIMVYDTPGTPNDGFKRIRTGATWTQLAEVNIGAVAAVTGYKHLSTVSRLEHYVTNDVSTSQIWKTLDGGATAIETTPQLSFFSGFSITDPRRAYGTNILGLGEGRYGNFIYTAITDGPNHRRHARVAKLDPVGTSWLVHSDQFTTDNSTSLIQRAAAGINLDGDMDFYLFVFDSAANTVKVYRASEPALSALETPVSDRFSYAAAGAAYVRWYDNLKAAAVGFPTGQSIRNNQTLWYFVGLGWVEDSRGWRDVLPLGVTDAVTKCFAWDYDAGILREVDVDEVYDDDGREIVGRVDTGMVPVASGPMGAVADLVARWSWLRFVTSEDVEVRVFGSTYDDDLTDDFEGRTSQDHRLNLVGKRARIVAYFTIRKFFRLSEILMRVVRYRSFRPR